MATPKQNRSSLGTDFPKLENQPTFSFHIFLPFKSESRQPLDRVGSTDTKKNPKDFMIVTLRSGREFENRKAYEKRKTKEEKQVEEKEEIKLGSSEKTEKSRKKKV